MESNDRPPHAGRDEAPEGLPTGQRGPARDSLFLAAQIRAGASAPVAVRVRNLSEGGLMAELPHAMNPDVPIEVEVRGIGWIAGRIAWQTGGRAGIAFDTQIDPQRARKPVGPRTDTSAIANFTARPVVNR